MIDFLRPDAYLRRALTFGVRLIIENLTDRVLLQSLRKS